jgi:hypothetical protein
MAVLFPILFGLRNHLLNAGGFCFLVICVVSIKKASFLPKSPQPTNHELKMSVYELGVFFFARNATISLRYTYINHKMRR